MPMIEPPSDEALCRCVRIAKMVGKCVYVVAEDGQWLPTEGDGPPRESASGEYYEVFPTGGRIQRRQVGTHTLLDEIWWADLMMRQYKREKVEKLLLPLVGERTDRRSD